MSTEQFTFKKLFYIYLNETGHNPQMTDDGDIFIDFRATANITDSKYILEDKIFFQFIDYDTTMYFRSYYRIDFACKTEDLRNKFYKAALITNLQVKFAKLCIPEKQIDKKRGLILVVFDMPIITDFETIKYKPSELKEYLDLSIISTQQAIADLSENITATTKGNKKRWWEKKNEK